MKVGIKYEERSARVRVQCNEPHQSQAVSRGNQREHNAKVKRKPELETVSSKGDIHG
jgi:hypothetical protein